LLVQVTEVEINSTAHISNGWHSELNDGFESSPDRGVEQFLVVGCRDQKALSRPVVNLLQKHCYETLQFADFGIVIAPFGDSVELVKQENARQALGVVENVSNIVACAPKEAAHDRRKVENHERPD